MDLIGTASPKRSSWKRNPLKKQSPEQDPGAASLTQTVGDHGIDEGGTLSIQQMQEETEALSHDTGLIGNAFNVRTQTGEQFTSMVLSKEAQDEKARMDRLKKNPELLMPFLRKFDPSQSDLQYKRKASPKVLIVDDNMMHLAASKIIFDNYLQHVFMAPNGRRGLELMEQYTFDLVLVTPSLPVMDGPTMVEIIRHVEAQQGQGAFRSLCIGMMTREQSQDSELMDACFISGMDRFILKPLITHVTLLVEILSVSRGTAEGFRRVALEKQWVARRSQLQAIIKGAKSDQASWTAVALTEDDAMKAEKGIVAVQDDDKQKMFAEDVLARQRQEEVARLNTNNAKMRDRITRLEHDLEKLQAEHAKVTQNKSEETILALESCVHEQKRQLDNAAIRCAALEKKAQEATQDIKNLLENGSANDAKVQSAQTTAMRLMHRMRVNEEQMMEHEDIKSQRDWNNYYGQAEIRNRWVPLPVNIVNIAPSWFSSELGSLKSMLTEFMDATMTRDNNVRDYLVRRSLVSTSLENLKSEITGAFDPHLEEAGTSLRALRRNMDEYLASHLVREVGFWKLVEADDGDLGKQISVLAEHLDKNKNFQFSDNGTQTEKSFGGHLGIGGSPLNRSSFARSGFGGSNELLSPMLKALDSNAAAGSASLDDDTFLTALINTQNEVQDVPTMFSQFKEANRSKKLSADQKEALLDAVYDSVTAEQERMMNALGDISRELTGEVMRIQKKVRDPNNEMGIHKPLLLSAAITEDALSKALYNVSDNLHVLCDLAMDTGRDEVTAKLQPEIDTLLAAAKAAPAAAAAAEEDDGEANDEKDTLQDSSSQDGPFTDSPASVGLNASMSDRKGKKPAKGLKGKAKSTNNLAATTSGVERKGKKATAKAAMGASTSSRLGESLRSVASSVRKKTGQSAAELERQRKATATASKLKKKAGKGAKGRKEDALVRSTAALLENSQYEASANPVLVKLPPDGSMSIMDIAEQFETTEEAVRDANPALILADETTALSTRDVDKVDVPVTNDMLDKVLDSIKQPGAAAGSPSDPLLDEDMLSGPEMIQVIEQQRLSVQTGKKRPSQEAAQPNIMVTTTTTETVSAATSPLPTTLASIATETTDSLANTTTEEKTQSRPPSVPKVLTSIATETTDSLANTTTEDQPRPPSVPKVLTSIATETTDSLANTTTEGRPQSVSQLLSDGMPSAPLSPVAPRRLSNYSLRRLAGVDEGKPDLDSESSTILGSSQLNNEASLNLKLKKRGILTKEQEVAVGRMVAQALVQSRHTIVVEHPLQEAEFWTSSSEDEEEGSSLHRAPKRAATMGSMPTQKKGKKETKKEAEERAKKEAEEKAKEAEEKAKKKHYRFEANELRYLYLALHPEITNDLPTSPLSPLSEDKLVLPIVAKDLVRPDVALVTIPIGHIFKAVCVLKAHHHSVVEEALLELALCAVDDVDHQERLSKHLSRSRTTLKRTMVATMKLIALLAELTQSFISDLHESQANVLTANADAETANAAAAAATAAAEAATAEAAEAAEAARKYAPRGSLHEIGVQGSPWVSELTTTAQFEDQGPSEGQGPTDIASSRNSLKSSIASDGTLPGADSAATKPKAAKRAPGKSPSPGKSPAPKAVPSTKRENVGKQNSTGGRVINDTVLKPPPKKARTPTRSQTPERENIEFEFNAESYDNPTEQMQRSYVVHEHGVKKKQSIHEHAPIPNAFKAAKLPTLSSSVKQTSNSPPRGAPLPHHLSPTASTSFSATKKGKARDTGRGMGLTPLAPGAPPRPTWEEQRALTPPMFLLAESINEPPLRGPEMIGQAASKGSAASPRSMSPGMLSLETSPTARATGVAGLAGLGLGSLIQGHKVGGQGKGTTSFLASNASGSQGSRKARDTSSLTTDTSSTSNTQGRGKRKMIGGPTPVVHEHQEQQDRPGSRARDLESALQAAFGGPVVVKAQKSPQQAYLPPVGGDVMTWSPGMKSGAQTARTGPPLASVGKSDLGEGLTGRPLGGAAAPAPSAGPKIKPTVDFASRFGGKPKPVRPQAQSNLLPSSPTSAAPADMISNTLNIKMDRPKIDWKKRKEEKWQQAAMMGAIKDGTFAGAPPAPSPGSQSLQPGRGHPEQAHSSGAAVGHSTAHGHLQSGPVPKQKASPVPETGLGDLRVTTSAGNTGHPSPTRSPGPRDRKDAPFPVPPPKSLHPVPPDPPNKKHNDIKHLLNNMTTSHFTPSVKPRGKFQ